MAEQEIDLLGQVRPVMLAAIEQARARVDQEQALAAADLQARGAAAELGVIGAADRRGAAHTPETQGQGIIRGRTVQ